MENKERDTYMKGVILVALLGVATFFAGGVVGNFVIIAIDQYLVALPLIGGVGALLLGVFVKTKEKLWIVALGGFLGLPAGLIASFALLEGLAALFPSIGASLDDTIVPDLLIEAIMGIVFGLVSSAVIYGRKALGLFAMVCGLCSIPGGLAVGLMNTSSYCQAWASDLAAPFNKIDYNLLAISATIGLGFGLAMGLYRKRMATRGDIASN